MCLSETEQQEILGEEPSRSSSPSGSSSSSSTSSSSSSSESDNEEDSLIPVIKEKVFETTLSDWSECHADENTARAAVQAQLAKTVAKPDWTNEWEPCCSFLEPRKAPKRPFPEPANSPPPPPVRPLFACIRVGIRPKKEIASKVHYNEMTELVRAAFILDDVNQLQNEHVQNFIANEAHNRLFQHPLIAKLRSAPYGVWLCEPRMFGLTVVDHNMSGIITHVNPAKFPTKVPKPRDMKADGLEYHYGISYVLDISDEPLRYRLPRHVQSRLDLMEAILEAITVMPHPEAVEFFSRTVKKIQHHPDFFDPTKPDRRDRVFANLEQQLLTDDHVRKQERGQLEANVQRVAVIQPSADENKENIPPCDDQLADGKPMTVRFWPCPPIQQRAPKTPAREMIRIPDHVNAISPDLAHPYLRRPRLRSFSPPVRASRPLSNRAPARPKEQPKVAAKVEAPPQTPSEQPSPKDTRSIDIKSEPLSPQAKTKAQKARPPKSQGPPKVKADDLRHKLQRLQAEVHETRKLLNTRDKPQASPKPHKLQAEVHEEPKVLSQRINKEISTQPQRQNVKARLGPRQPRVTGNDVPCSIKVEQEPSAPVPNPAQQVAVNNCVLDIRVDGTMNKSSRHGSHPYRSKASPSRRKIQRIKQRHDKNSDI